MGARPDGDDVFAPRLAQALRWAVRRLAAASPTPRLEAELLLAEVMGLRREEVIAGSARRLSPAQARRFNALIRRRAAGEPLAYILGRRAFYDGELLVGPGALVPRPESEQLVEETLAWCRARDGERPWRLADVGTGGGALAVTLARHLPHAWVWATDVSAQALEVARRNVRRLDLARRVLLLQADLLAPLAGMLDVIVANLPYVPAARLAELAPEVSRWEPRQALDGGPDGLAVVRRLLVQAPALLGRPGLLLAEIDEGQGQAAAEAGRAAWPAAEVRVLRDLAGFERVLRIEI